MEPQAAFDANASLVDDGQRDGERGPFALAADHPDVAPHLTHDLAGSGEAEPGTSHAGDIRGAAVAGEELGQVVLGDPEPAVLDPDAGLVPCRVDRDADLPSGLRELDRVAQQVVEDALEAAKVGVDTDRWGPIR